ncbi:MAG: YicC/YloC family endoribonuclease [Gallibacter sp.]|nr:YicC/YloC family endoribonuclease [Gallibacter sp.]
MLKSMTGYGLGEFTNENKKITVEIKAVNQRYCDISVRLPRKYMFAEEEIKSDIKNTIHRGKVDVFISVENIGEPDVEIYVDNNLAQEYKIALFNLADKLEIEQKLSLEYISSIKDVVTTRPKEADQDDIKNEILSAVNVAITNFDQMRITEGEKLKADILTKNEDITKLLSEIKSIAVKLPEIFKQRLTDKLSNLLDGNTAINEDRIVQEVAIFADRASIDEEITRLESHIKQLIEIVSIGGPCGKKIDFLIQEMNRETNTIGSKANDLDITKIVVEIKSNIEKIREQVQNIE